MNFYRGVIEDNNDPEKIGRVRVRVFGVHTENNEYSKEFEHINKSHLPWAEVMGATAFGLISNVGVSSVLKKGTWVWVVFENDNSNKPIVVGTIIGNNVEKLNYSSGVGFCDPSGVYPKNLGSDLHPKVQSKYNDVSIIKTQSGHIIDLDDTAGEESITITHMSGTKIQIDSEGNLTINSLKNIKFIAAENIIMTAKNIQMNP